MIFALKNCSEKQKLTFHYWFLFDNVLQLCLYSKMQLHRYFAVIFFATSPGIHNF